MTDNHLTELAFVANLERATPGLDSVLISNRVLQGSVAEIARLNEQLTEAREIIRPFANIVPSSLYPDDGSENEPYCVILKQDNVKNPAEITGAHLARARAFLKGETDNG